MDRFTLYLPPQLLERLRALMERTGLSVAEHIRRAISEYLDRLEA